MVVLFVRINESYIALEVVNAAPKRHDTHEADGDPGNDTAVPDHRLEDHNKDRRDLRYGFDLAEPACRNDDLLLGRCNEQTQGGDRQLTQNDNERHPDAKLGVDGNRQSSSLYDMIPAKPQNSKPAGEWNKVKIMVYKGTVVHFQNDVPVVEYHLWTPQWTEMLQKSKFSEEKWPVAFNLLNNCGGENHEGYIGFQDHGDDVWFRNIKVKVLE